MSTNDKKSYPLTQEQFNYLLPVLRSNLLERGEKYYFIGDSEEVEDMYLRLKGLSVNYTEII